LRSRRILWLAGANVLMALVVAWLAWWTIRDRDADETAPPDAMAQAETLGRRLLRAVQLGAAQGLSVDLIRQVADDANGGYETVILARSALMVLHRDTEARRIAYLELLDRVLNNLARSASAYRLAPDLPEAHGKDLALIMVYALVMSGNRDRVTDLLEKHLTTGSAYKQAVALQGLRNIGTPRAIGLIQKYAESGADKNLAQTTLADEDYPVLAELQERWTLVPPRERRRDKLLGILQSEGACSERAAMAAYWLGFFPPSADAERERRELDALKAMIRRNTGFCEMIGHIIALKSLALRSAESVEFWAELARQTENVWERHQVVIDGWGRWGRAFAPAALDLLKTEPTQYVQWELMQGSLQTAQGHRYRDYWDLWIPVNILVLLQEGDEAGSAMEKPEMDRLLAWLEAGARPKDPWVANHMIYNLARSVSGDDTRRLLALFNQHPQRNQNWWIVSELGDPGALPLLRYWASLPAPADQAAMLKGLIDRLQSDARSGTAPGAACCQATRACLAEWLARPSESPAPIRSEDEARTWLAGTAGGGGYTLDYRDALERLAVVHRQDGTEERWEYLYDCWRNVTRP